MERVGSRAGGVFGIAVALLVLASAWAHGALGWPPFEAALAAASVAPEVVGGLAVGWYFGSASMLAFGLVVLQQALRLLAGRTTDAGALGLIAGMYVLFGTVAFLARDSNPHFLLFILTGVLVGFLAVLCRRARSGSGRVILGS